MQSILMTTEAGEFLFFILAGIPLFAVFYRIQKLFKKSSTKSPTAPTQTKASPQGIDGVLLHWNHQNPYKISEFLQGGLSALGTTGSGKTSSLKHLAKAILEWLKSSMFIMCAKPGEAQEWLELARLAGREQDVIHFHIASQYACNLLQHEAIRSGAGGGQATNITRFLMQLRGAVLRESENVGGDSLQWLKQDERGLFNAITLLLQAGETIEPQNIQQMILTAPKTREQLQSAAWQGAFCNRVLAQAFSAPKSPQQQHDFDQASTYFSQEWPSMGDRTQGSIMTGIMSILGLIGTGECRRLFFEKSNIDPEILLAQGRIVIVDFPPDEFGDLGMVANLGMKMIWQKAILRRTVTPETPLAVIWGDESSLWFSKSDVEFLSRCRQSRGAMVYISQSIHAYKTVLPGDKSESLVNALLANFSHKLFFALGDYDSAEFAANLCGKELTMMNGGGTQHGNYEPLSLFRNESQSSSNYHEQYEYIVRPEHFVNNLRTGGVANNLKVDAILLRSGRPFNTGYNVLPVTFDQRIS